MPIISRYKWLAGIILISLAVLVVYQNIPPTQAQRLNQQCQAFGESVIEEHRDIYDRDVNRKFFYSKRIDTCVKQEVDELGNKYSLCDIKRNYIKKDFEEVGICGGIFYCDKDGVDNVVIEKADKYNGDVFRLNYSEYLDDGEGGMPRTLKAPEKPYTREKCEGLFNQKLLELK